MAGESEVLIWSETNRSNTCQVSKNYRCWGHTTEVVGEIKRPIQLSLFRTRSIRTKESGDLLLHKLLI